MILIIINKPWARSSVGRAPRSQRGGHQSDSGRVHHIWKTPIMPSHYRLFFTKNYQFVLTMSHPKILGPILIALRASSFKAFYQQPLIYSKTGILEHISQHTDKNGRFLIHFCHFFDYLLAISSTKCLPFLRLFARHFFDFVC